MLNVNEMHYEVKLSNLSTRRTQHVYNFMFKQNNNKKRVDNRNIRTRAHDAICILLCYLNVNNSSIISFIMEHAFGISYLLKREGLKSMIIFKMYKSQRSFITGKNSLLKYKCLFFLFFNYTLLMY